MQLVCFIRTRSYAVLMTYSIPGSTFGVPAVPYTRYPSLARLRPCARSLAKNHTYYGMRNAQC